MTGAVQSAEVEMPREDTGGHPTQTTHPVCSNPNLPGFLEITK